MRSSQLPLDVVGEVQALFADQPVLMTAKHDTITVDLPSLRAGVMAFRAVGGGKQRARTIGGANAALHFTALNMHVQLAGRTVARLGVDARAGLLSRLLGVSPLEIRLSDLVCMIGAFWR